MADLSSLEFQIDVKSNGASKGIDALASSFSKLKNSLKGVSNLEQVSKGLDAISNVNTGTLDTLEKLGSSLYILGQVKISGTIAKQLTAIGAAVDSIHPETVEKLLNMSSSLSNIPNMGVVAQSVGTANISKSTSGTTSAVSPETSEIAELHSKIAELTESMQGTASASEQAKTHASSFFKELKANIKTASQVAAKVRQVTASLTGFDRISNTVKDAASRIGQFMSSIKRIMMYRIIRAAISALTQGVREGMNNLYQYSNMMGGTFAASMDRLATSFQYLKNSLGAMVSPLINAIAPAVDMLIDKFVSLLNIVNQVFARLSGASFFTKAKKAATSYGGAVAGAGGAAKKAAKDIKDATSDLDELNIISQPDNSGSGGGSGGSGGGGGYADMFEEVPIDSNIKDFVDQVKDAFNAGDWDGVGRILGDKFNEIVDNFKWKEWGEKLGKVLNAGIEISHSFLETADFRNLGNKIGDFLNSALGEINFYTLGSTMVLSILKGIDVAIGVIERLDWNTVGKSIGDYLRGAFDTARDWLLGYDWFEMGQKVFDAMGGFILGLNPEGIATSFGKLLGVGLTAVFKFLGGFIARGIISIGKYFEQKKDMFTQYGIDEGVAWVMGILQGIAEGIWKINTAPLDYVVQPLVQGIAEAFGKETSDTKWSDQITGSMLKLFGNAEVDAWVDENWGKTANTAINSITETTQSRLDDVKNTSAELGNAMTDGLTSNEYGAINAETFAEFSDESLEAFVNSAVSHEAELQGLYSDLGGTTSAFTDKVNSSVFSGFAETALKGFREKFEKDTPSVATTVTNAARTIKNGFTENGEMTSKSFQSVANGILSGYDSEITRGSSKSKSVSSAWGSSSKKGFTDQVKPEQFKAVASNAVNGFNTGISKNYTTSQGHMNTWGSSVVNWFRNPGGTSLETHFTNIGQSCVNAFHNGFNNGSLWNQVQQTVQNRVNAIIAAANASASARGGLATAQGLDDLESSYDISDAIESNVNASTSVDSSAYKSAMESFYREYVERPFLQMVSDMRRQADKEETTIVKIGSKTITDTVTEQKSANGYSFTT